VVQTYYFFFAASLFPDEAYFSMKKGVGTYCFILLMGLLALPLLLDKAIAHTKEYAGSH